MTERILAQARKFGLGGLWATQNLDQITDTVRSAMFGNTTVRFAGGLSHKDANAMANEMYTTGDRIRSLRKVDREYAEFACHIKNITPVAVKLQVPFGRMEAAAVRELPVFQKPVGSTEATTLPSSSPKPEPGTQPTQARQQPSSNAEAASPPVDPSTPSKW